MSEAPSTVTSTETSKPPVSDTPAGGAKPPVETAPKVDPKKKAETVTPETPKEDPKLARQFAALSREQRKLQQTKAELKTLQDQINTFNERKKTFRTSPEELLKDIGYQDTQSFMDEVVSVLNPKGPASDADRIAKLEKQLAERAEADKQAQKKAEELASVTQLDQARAYTKQFIQNAGNDPEGVHKYECILAIPNGTDKVFEIIYEEYRKTGKERTIQEVADVYETYLLEEAQKITALKKLQAKQLAAPEAKQDTAKTAEPKASISKALSNRKMAAPSNTEPALTKAQRAKLAVEALKERNRNKQ